MCNARRLFSGASKLSSSFAYSFIWYLAPIGMSCLRSRNSYVLESSIQQTLLQECFERRFVRLSYWPKLPTPWTHWTDWDICEWKWLTLISFLRQNNAPHTVSHHFFQSNTSWYSELFRSKISHFISPHRSQHTQKCLASIIAGRRPQWTMLGVR